MMDNKHFQDLRALLKSSCGVEEHPQRDRSTGKIIRKPDQKIFTPETEPYSLMLKITGYSMPAEQEIILTLPFIFPGLEHLYSVHAPA
jgi:hypothetical protein